MLRIITEGLGGIFSNPFEIPSPAWKHSAPHLEGSEPTTSWSATEDSTVQILSNEAQPTMVNSTMRQLWKEL